MILLKPPQPACTGGCPIKTAATCVTGKRLAHGLPRSNGRVTTQRSAVVTRTYSGPKCAAWRIFLNTGANAAKIMVSLSKYFLQLQERRQPMACLYFSYAISFIRDHCVYSGNQGTTGSCNGASVQAAIHLPNQNNSQSLFYLPGIRLSFTHELCARRLPLAIVLSRSFSINRRVFLLTSKEVFRHTQRTPVLGHVGLRRAIPQLRKACVASDQAFSGRLGVVSHDRSAQADLSAAAAR